MPVASDPVLADTPAGRDGRAADVPRRWPPERILFALAGTVTLVSVALAVLVSPWFLVLTALVGINQWLYVTVRACPASLVLQRVGVAPRCRW